MARSFVRFVLALGVLAGLLVVPALSRDYAGAQQTGSPVGQGVLIGQTGVIGAYGLPEPPAFPPVNCAFDAARANVSITPPGLVAVQAKPQYAIQKVDVQNRLYQRLANGTYSLVQTMGGGSILAVNHELTPVPGTTTFNQPAGLDYVYAHHIIFYAPDFTKVEGTVTIAYSTYRPTVTGSSQTFPDAAVCGRIAQPQPSPSPTPTKTPVPGTTPTPIPTTTTPPVPTTTPTPGIMPDVEVSALAGTVGSRLRYTISGFPRNSTVSITFDGTKIGSATTDGSGTGSGSFKIPAAPAGLHTIRWNSGNTSAFVDYTIKPRIKVVPNLVTRHQAVNVSFTGYAKNEVVRIRWKWGPFFVQTARVTTDAAGSANINTRVPWFVSDGQTSVRGDGMSAHAQTNAVTVIG